MKKSLKLTMLFASLMLCKPLIIDAQWTTPSSGGTINNNILNSKVGIGNGSAFNVNDRLEVRNGNILLEYGGSNATGNLYFGGKPDNNVSGFRLSMVQNASGYIDFRTGSGTAAASNGLIFRVDVTNTGTVLNSERMRITAAGNVGINTAGLASGPTEKLQIDKGVLKMSSIGPYGGPMILFSENPNASYVGDWGIEYVPTGNFKGLNFWKPFGSPNGGNDYLFLADNGNVGVRTNNPTANFTVNGNMVVGDPAVVCIPSANYRLFVQTGILTEKVKVAINCATDWSDYVFEENYKLTPLKEVENYVIANKHLPNVPSANEVVQNGLDLGAMDAKLLEKVEELTLYLIQQNKKIESLEQEIVALKSAHK